MWCQGLYAFYTLFLHTYMTRLQLSFYFVSCGHWMVIFLCISRGVLKWYRKRPRKCIHFCSVFAFYHIFVCRFSPLMTLEETLHLTYQRTVVICLLWNRLILYSMTLFSFRCFAHFVHLVCETWCAAKIIDDIIPACCYLLSLVGVGWSRV